MKILVIRTIQSDLLGAMLNSLNDSFPGAKIYLFDNLKQAEFSKAQQHIDGRVIFTKRKGDYGVTNISLSTIAKIRKINFDKVVVSHKQYGIEGFNNVLLLLYLLNIKRWFHCRIDWDLRDISKFYIIKIIFYNIITQPVFLLLLPVGIISFIYLFIAEKLPQFKMQDPEPWKCGPEDI